MKKIISVLLTVSLCFVTLFSVSFSAEAAGAKLNKTKATVAIGQTVNLYLKSGGSKVTSGVKWSSNAKGVAAVSKKGVVKTKKAGKAVITAKYKGKNYKCTVKVRNSVSASTTNVTLAKSATSKNITITFKESGTVSYKILSGDDLIECSWSSKWNGDDTRLTIKRDNIYTSGTARVKVYSKKYKKNYVIINVKLVSACELKIVNQLPVILTNYERKTTLNPDGVKNTVKVNSATYSVSSSGKMTITVDFTANSSNYAGSDYYYIYFKVTDEEGYVVKSSYIMSDRLSVGDKAKEEINLYDLEPGVYKLEFLDHIAD